MTVQKTTNQNQRAQLASAYNELGKELSSSKVKVVGNYTLGRVIGEGAYGKVRMGTHRLTSMRVAIKQIPKAMSASLTREIHHHRHLHHPHVMQMYEVIATESSIWIVTELCSGGELFDYLAEKGRLEENDARILFGQLCLAVGYIHEKGVVHRDLKLENVLLDERCRVKLGDYGFTREFDRNVLMDTFCGTTGYAAPEMLAGEKYLGAEVDIWSMGIILYCLLTGTLPFDDDDEAVMKDMIMKGNFEDPEWLSDDARDLIKNILQHDPTKRLSIAQILAHPWFTSARPNVPETVASPISTISEDPLAGRATTGDDKNASPLSALSIGTFVTAASSEPASSIPPTPDESVRDDPFLQADETTLKAKARNKALEALQANSNKQQQPREENPFSTPNSKPHPPSSYPSRTPARTKRRSVSSNLSLSPPSSPTTMKPHSPNPPQDFTSLFNTPAPVIFSTPLDRQLLNSLSSLGFDTGQIVHSVLSDACDAAGAVWWMLRKKAEKRAAEQTAGPPLMTTTESESVLDHPLPSSVNGGGGMEKEKKSTSVQTEYSSRGSGTRKDSQGLSVAKSAPELAFVPPTPTVESNRPLTPPQAMSKSITLPLLSPSQSSLAEGGAGPSAPSTPSGSVERNGNNLGSKGKSAGKARSGSVSIMQRANTALEAVGIVRKRSAEAVKDIKDGDKHAKDKDADRKAPSAEESRTSHSSATSSKLTKSPPMKALATPSASPDMKHAPAQATVGSPWVVMGSAPVTHPAKSNSPTPSSSPGDTLTALPNFTENTPKGPSRSRASILNTFRLWFNEDRKGKRKEGAASPEPNSMPTNKRGRNMMYGRLGAPRAGQSKPVVERATVQRRTSGGGARRGVRAQRISNSSRRSSSINSRHSSGSAQVVVLDSPLPMLEHVRSYGTHTPVSERGDYSSRPSSVQSLSRPRHRKSPSASSGGSTHYRSHSPHHRNHRRAGSGSSTRVVRQPATASASRPTHHRTTSATSSVKSLPPSRPSSFYDPSDTELQRTGSPFKPSRRQSADDATPRRGGSGSTFIAQKRQTPFVSPLYAHSASRSSWKKSWGLEPPGWQTRNMHIPVEVISISPSLDGGAGIRDVFSNRPTSAPGDESDWVDEDDDVGPFAVGLGQTPTSTTGFNPNEQSMLLQPPPRNSNRSGKRANKGMASGNAGASARGQKAQLSPIKKTTALPGTDAPSQPAESRSGASGRRPVPTGRAGPSFGGHAMPIQEEDEDEEEE